MLHLEANNFNYRAESNRRLLSGVSDPTPTDNSDRSWPDGPAFFASPPTI